MSGFRKFHYVKNTGDTTLTSSTTTLKLQMQTICVTLLLWESSAVRPVQRRPRCSVKPPQFPES